jgi:cytochrome c553
VKLTLTLLSLIGIGAAHANEMKPEFVVERAVHICQACHGDSAREKGDSIPNIAGQMPLYIQAQLKDFRSQTRAESDVQAYMWGISALLDDETINGLSEYFAGQAPVPGRPGKANRVAEGRKIFDRGIPERGIRACAGCHGANAEGASVFPRLAGQKAAYVLTQLQVFGTRLRPHGILMKNEVAELSPEQMRDVAEYVQSR